MFWFGLNMKILFFACVWHKKVLKVAQNIFAKATIYSVSAKTKRGRIVIGFSLLPINRAVQIHKEKYNFKAEVPQIHKQRITDINVVPIYIAFCSCNFVFKLSRSSLYIFLSIYLFDTNPKPKCENAKIHVQLWFYLLMGIRKLLGYSIRDDKTAAELGQSNFLRPNNLWQSVTFLPIMF